VDNLAIYKGKLVAAAYDGVWTYNLSKWKKIDTGLNISSKHSVYCFCEWNGKLVAGFWGKPSVAIYNNDSWSYLPSPEHGWGKNTRTIYCLSTFNGYLYAATGTGKEYGEPSSIWRFDGKKWEKIAGSGIRGSWLSDGIPFVLSMTSYHEHLVVTLSRPHRKQSPVTSNVWAFDGNTWKPLDFGKIPELFSSSSIPNHSLVFQDHLLVATGDSIHRNTEVWRWSNKKNWIPIGPLIEDLSLPIKSNAGGMWIYRMCTDNKNTLYVSTAGHLGAARIFSAHIPPTQD
jgi:hypothetical protein